LLAEVSTRAQQGTSLMNVRAQLGIPAGVYAAGARGAAALHQAIEILRAQSLTAQMEVDRARKCVLEAHTRVRALEKLRERAQKEHRREVGRVEQAEFDEIAARKSGWPE
jgi:flagellar export protein FliJ